MSALGSDIRKPTLGIDYGGQRVGLAVSVGFAPRPIDVLSHGNVESLIARILDVASTERVARIVVGLPLNADGTEGPQADVTRKFAKLLAAETLLPVMLWDERHTSQQAEEQMIAAGTSAKARREKLDAIAAALLLQDFFANDGVSAELVTAEESDDQDE